MDCGCSLEPPQVLACTRGLCFGVEMYVDIVKIIPPKIVIFTDVKNRCMLHGHVFVMLLYDSDSTMDDRSIFYI